MKVSATVNLAFISIFYKGLCCCFKGGTFSIIVYCLLKLKLKIILKFRLKLKLKIQLKLQQQQQQQQEVYYAARQCQNLRKY